MTLFYAVLGVVAVGGLGWALTQLARITSAPRLAALVGLLVFWALSWPFGVAANAGGALGLDALDARTVEHALRLVATACMLAFVVATPVPGAPRPARGGRRTVVHGVLLAAAVLGLVVNSALVPAGRRDQLARLADGSAGGADDPVGSTPVAVFFLVENVYYVTVFAAAAVWAAGHLRRPTPAALRRGLQLLVAGSVVLVVATGALLVSVVLRWSGERPPPAINAVGLSLLALGLLVVLAGLILPSVAHAVTGARLTLRRRRVHRELEPLWAQLRDAFPDEVTRADPPAGPDADGRQDRAGRLLAAVVPGGGPSRRYYRRIIECRDGLHHLGPYLRAVAARDGRPEGGVPTGEDLLAALELRRSGAEADPAGPVGSPTAHDVGVDEEVEALVLLARRLTAASRAADRGAVPGDVPVR